MDIRVSGHQVDTGAALQTHVETRLGSIAEKHFSKALSAHATFGRAPHDGFTSDIVMHVMQGLVLKGRGEAQDAHVALDRAAERIEKQLRRYMRRLQDRHLFLNHGNSAIDRLHAAQLRLRVIGQAVEIVYESVDSDGGHDAS